MAYFIRDDDLAGLFKQHLETASEEVKDELQKILDEANHLPRRTMATGIPLWDVCGNFGHNELLWLCDKSTGKIVARGWSRLSRFRDVTITRFYTVLTASKDGKKVFTAVVCVGDHDEIEAVRKKKRP